jgi:hypothetical protein
MFHVNIALESTSVAELAPLELLSKELNPHPIDLGRMADGVSIALNSAADTTVHGLKPDEIEGGVVVVRNAQPVGGYSVAFAARSAEAPTHSQFAEAFRLVPQQSAKLRRRGGKWQAV